MRGCAPGHQDDIEPPRISRFSSRRMTMPASRITGRGSRNERSRMMSWSSTDVRATRCEGRRVAAQKPHLVVSAPREGGPKFRRRICSVRTSARRTRGTGSLARERQQPRINGRILRTTTSRGVAPSSRRATAQRMKTPPRRRGCAKFSDARGLGHVRPHGCRWWVWVIPHLPNPDLTVVSSAWMSYP